MNTKRAREVFTEYAELVGLEIKGWAGIDPCRIDALRNIAAKWRKWGTAWRDNADFQKANSCEDIAEKLDEVIELIKGYNGSGGGYKEEDFNPEFFMEQGEAG